MCGPTSLCYEGSLLVRRLGTLLFILTYFTLLPKLYSEKSPSSASFDTNPIVESTDIKSTSSLPSASLAPYSSIDSDKKEEDAPNSLLFPNPPAIRLSPKAGQFLLSSCKVRVNFKIDEGGKVIKPSIYMESSCPLHPLIKKEISTQLLKWRWKTPITKKSFTLDYSIIKDE